ncbi:hypothetical protein [Pseudomonas protegens]|uniref:hypothetical protein n=1 Tax=Pseudomonas protegens TaxID=380021 RepID=UPI00380FCE48
MDYTQTLRKLYRTPKLTAPFIEEAFQRQHGVSVTVRSVDVGKSGFEIVSDAGTFLLLERPVTYYNENWGRVTTIQTLMLEFGVPVPLYIGQGDMSSSFKTATDSPEPQLAVDRWLYEIFEIDLVVTYFLDYFSNSEALKKYKLIILEAVESFYMGLDHVAIMALIPVFEGGLRNLQNLILDEDKGNVSGAVFEKRLRAILKDWGGRRVSQYAWHPGIYGIDSVEVDFYTHICMQSDVINCFRLFFKNVLYKPTGKKLSGFNRHVIMHMLDNNFNNATNFYRMFLALTHITFIEALTNKNVPLFWQGYNERSKQLINYIELLSKNMDGRRRLLESFGVAGYPTIS